MAERVNTLPFFTNHKRSNTMDWLKSQWASWKVKVSVVGGVLVIATAYGSCEVDPGDVSTNTTTETTETTGTTGETVEVSATTTTETATTGTETTGTEGGTTTETTTTTE